MTLEQQNEHLGVLIKAARTNNRALMWYRKSVSRKPIVERLVEPYSLNSGKQDTLVRCYQVGPEAGWRTFMVHKIERLEITPEMYHPRRKVTLCDAEIEPVYEPSPFWTEGRIAYRDMVCDALADGFVSKHELAEIKSLIESSKLTLDDTRYVHASLFHRCLGAVLEDGFISDEEVAEIRFLHKVFAALGWTVGQ